MYTVDNALESLQKYDISQDDLLKWERALGLDIPVDKRGEKIYSPHHINLFKNVKKHIALGRTLEQIKNIITLPPISKSMPENNPTAEASTLSDDREFRKELRKEKPILTNEQPVAKTQEATVRQDATVRPEVLQPGHRKPAPVKNQYASAPQRPKTPSPAAATVVELVNKLSAEKDHLYRKLLETEKLNSHLYSANNMYHRRVKELDQNVSQLRDQLHLNENFKLMEDKDRLHKQLIEFEKANQERESDLRRHLQEKEADFKLLSKESQKEINRLIEEKNNALSQLRQEKESELKALEKEKENAIKHLIQEKENALSQLNADMALADEAVRRLEERIAVLSQPFEPSVFCGDWMETGQLSEIVYDNFGVNIEAERVRLFRISKKPERIFGNTAVITTTYQYETNSQWKRQETLVVAWTDAQILEGEVTAEYILDGVPVAKAVYQVTCKRNV